MNPCFQLHTLLSTPQISIILKGVLCRPKDLLTTCDIRTGSFFQKKSFEQRDYKAVKNALIRSYSSHATYIIHTSFTHHCSVEFAIFVLADFCLSAFSSFTVLELLQRPVPTFHFPCLTQIIIPMIQGGNFHGVKSIDFWKTWQPLICIKNRKLIHCSSCMVTVLL